MIMSSLTNPMWMIYHHCQKNHARSCECTGKGSSSAATTEKAPQPWNLSVLTSLQQHHSQEPLSMPFQHSLKTLHRLGSQQPEVTPSNWIVLRVPFVARKKYRDTSLQLSLWLNQNFIKYVFIMHGYLHATHLLI